MSDEKSLICMNCGSDFTHSIFWVILFDDLEMTDWLEGGEGYTLSGPFKTTCVLKAGDPCPLCFYKGLCEILPESNILIIPVEDVKCIG